jgi:sialate O-acetylesterase
MRPTRPILTIAAFAAVAAACLAAPELAPLFRDHAVLQSGKPVPVWGRATAGEHVDVSFSGQKLGATAGADGRWMVVLAPMEPSPTGADLTAVGKGSVVARDVVVGEVWLCAGGANMGSALGSSEAHAAPDGYPLIRQFRVGLQASASPLDAAQGDWATCTPQAAGGFSAVGYSFAREIFARLSVPVGIVVSSCADAPIESWMSPQALGVPASSGAGSLDPRLPSAAFNGMIHPLLPFAIRGAVWYQGEGDVGRARGYALRFRAMITAWRSHFGQGDIPFLWVQMEGSRAAGGHAAFREAQGQALSLPATGEAVAIDLGSAGGLTPAQRREIGRRLALIAKANAYNIEDDYSGPAYDGIEAFGPSLRVHFRFAGEGLTASGRPLQSFELAGADRVFHAATATIDGDTVVVRSAAVKQPVAVRYAWADAPDANLFNGAGLPAAPFRSDSW